jgi:hypothetical protein
MPDSIHKLAASVHTGQRILTSSDEVFRVVAKTASSNGVSFTLSGKAGLKVVSASALAEMQPITSRVEKFARFVRVAYNPDFDLYVNGAIESAGYPTDPKMKWAKWLDSVYTKGLYSVTQDADTIDDGIHAMLVNELFEKRVLSPDSEYAHFNPDHAALAGKPLEQKVSAYLSMLFKSRVSWARDYILKEMGATTGAGEKGFQLPQGLDDVGSREDAYSGEQPSGITDIGEIGADGNGSNPTAEMESASEVDTLLTKFMSTIRTMKNLPEDVKQMTLFITNQVMNQVSREDIREAFLESGLKTRKGTPVNPEVWKVAMRKWVDLIRAYVNNPKSGFSGTPIGRLISTQAEKLKAASLKYAASPTNPVTPVNPNVAQQQQAQGVQAQPPVPPTDFDMQKPGVPNEQEMNPAQQQQTPASGATEATTPSSRKTIPPEIPGENHLV